MQLMKNCHVSLAGLAVSILLIASPLHAQVVDGLLQVECKKGCGSGGGGGATTDIVAINGTPIVGVNLPVSVVGNITFSNASINIGNIPHVICDSGCAAGAPGQQTMANSQPVVIASNQSAVAVTGPITDTQLRSSAVPVSFTTPISVTQSGTWTVNQGGTWNVGLSTGSNVIGSISNTAFGIIQTGTNNDIDVLTLPSIPTGSNTIGAISNTGFNVNNFPATQNIAQPNTSATGTVTALNGTFEIAASGVGTTSLSISGTWVGTLVFYGKNGAGTALVIYGSNVASGSSDGLTSVNGDWLLPSAGWSSIGVLATAWTSGTANIALQTGRAATTIILAKSLPPGTNAIGSITNTGFNVTGSLPAGTNNIGDVDVLTLPSIPAGTNRIGSVRPVDSADADLTSVKGTQTARAVGTQDLKDAGRTLVTLTADNVTPILTTDTLVTFTKLVGDTATASVTTYPVTSGKTLRVTSISFNMTPNSTTVAYLRVRLRTLSSGTCIASSPLVGIWGTSSPPGTIAANAGGVETVVVPFPDGIEFSGANRNICITMNVLGAAAQTVNITLTGYEY